MKLLKDLAKELTRLAELFPNAWVGIRPSEEDGGRFSLFGIPEPDQTPHAIKSTLGVWEILGTGVYWSDWPQGWYKETP